MKASGGKENSEQRASSPRGRSREVTASAIDGTPLAFKVFARFWGGEDEMKAGLYRISREKGEVRIPIERAMEMVVMRGSQETGRRASPGVIDHAEASGDSE